MSIERINVVLTAEQKANILATVGALEEALPFRVSLTSAERQRLMKLGNKSAGFVQQAYEAARSHPDFIPATIDLNAMENDQELRELLLICAQRLGVLYTQVQDTATAAGVDLMKSATAIYRTLKANVEDGGLHTTLNALGQRFDRPSRRPRGPSEERSVA